MHRPRFLVGASAIRTVLSMLAAAVVCLYLGAGAIANTYGSYNVPDSVNHTFFYGSGFGSDWTEQADWARTTNIGSATKMTTSKQTTHSATVDVHAQVGNYEDTGWAGKAQCKTSTGTYSSPACEHWHVYFNTYPAVKRGYSYQYYEKRHLACHEFGHTVGLDHYQSKPGSPTCMWKDFAIETFNQHDINHINKFICDRYGKC